MYVIAVTINTDSVHSTLLILIILIIKWHLLATSMINNFFFYLFVFIYEMQQTNICYTCRYLTNCRRYCSYNSVILSSIFMSFICRYRLSVCHFITIVFVCFYYRVSVWSGINHVSIHLFGVLGTMKPEMGVYRRECVERVCIINNM